MMIIDTLLYWVSEMHVDGFRFDLVSILSRDAIGHVLPHPPSTLGHRIRPFVGRHQADCRGIGCGPFISGS